MTDQGPRGKPNAAPPVANFDRKPKEVCIVGAGPSGIVAAKTLIHDFPKGTFNVTIFEAQDRIGGLWPVSRNDNGIVNPEMRTNQSRHTVSFSGLAWPDSARSFPRAWQVGQYLQRYLEKYPGFEIMTNTRVVDSTFANNKWMISTKSTRVPNCLRSHVFDHVIVCTGFFGKPREPTIPKDFPAVVLHSCEFRDLKTLPSGPSLKSSKNVVVVGGQMSGVEVAAAIAFQLSSAENSPGKACAVDVLDYYITHVVQNPLWVMPLFLPKEPMMNSPEAGNPDKKVPNFSSPFLPCDLVTYNLEWRPAGPLQNQSGHISKEAALATHDFLETYIGTDQDEFGAHLSMNEEARYSVPFLAVSDSYPEFVRSGKIKTVQGKVVAGADNGLMIKDGDTVTTVEDVATVVLAIGFTASPSLEFLPKAVLQELRHDRKSDAFPLALNVHSTASKYVPSLGFVGFYRSPYWGVMEMQARYLGALWTEDSKALAILETDLSHEDILRLREDPRRAQFPMGDYAYLMESFSKILSIERFESSETQGHRTGLVLGQRYLSPTASEEERSEARDALATIDRTISDSVTNGKYVARAVFRAIQGDWKLERIIESRDNNQPSGTLSGNAYFKPRFPTDLGFDLEYLFQEEGEFRTGNFKFHTKRNYVYRYTETTDILSTWFTKPKADKEVDYFFYSLQFVSPSEEEAKTGKSPWRANADHLCIKDLYNVEYEFYFKGAALREWRMEYTVTGPSKDYTIKNVFTRR